MTLEKRLLYPKYGGTVKGVEYTRLIQELEGIVGTDKEAMSGLQVREGLKIRSKISEMGDSSKTSYVEELWEERYQKDIAFYETFVGKVENLISMLTELPADSEQWEGFPEERKEIQRMKCERYLLDTNRYLKSVVGLGHKELEAKMKNILGHPELLNRCSRGSLNRLLSSNPDQGSSYLGDFYTGFEDKVQNVIGTYLDIEDRVQNGIDRLLNKIL
jgi:hypothetical protein